MRDSPPRGTILRCHVWQRSLKCDTWRTSKSRTHDCMENKWLKNDAGVIIARHASIPPATTQKHAENEARRHPYLATRRCLCVMRQLSGPGRRFVERKMRMTSGQNNHFAPSRNKIHTQAPYQTKGQFRLFPPKISPPTWSEATHWTSFLALNDYFAFNLGPLDHIWRLWIWTAGTWWSFHSYDVIKTRFFPMFLVRVFEICPLIKAFNRPLIKAFNRPYLREQFYSAVENFLTIFYIVL